MEYLANTYFAIYIIKSGFFFIIQYEVMPMPEKRAFLVADYLAIWLHQDKPLPNNLGFYGEFLMGKMVVLPANLVLFLQLFTIPSNETLDVVAKLIFLNILYISYIICCIILEFLKTDYKIFVIWLETLPRGFTNSFISLNYMNRILVLSSYCRIIKLNSHLLNELLDKKDYIEKARCFFPSTMISSETNR